VTIPAARSLTFLVKWVLIGTAMSGTALAASVALPEMPDGFEDWKAVTLLAFVCIFGFVILAGVCYMLFRALMAQVQAQLRSAAALTEHTVALSALRGVLSEAVDESKATNLHLITLAVEVKSKPCLSKEYHRYLQRLDSLGVGPASEGGVTCG
jgi:hypothetical protein